MKKNELPITSMVCQEEERGFSKEGSELKVKRKSLLFKKGYCIQQKITIFIQSFYSRGMTDDQLPVTPTTQSEFITSLTSPYQKPQTSELEMEVFNLKARYKTHTHTHTGRLSTPWHGLTAVQGCRVQTTQISCRMRSLQYVGNRRKTTYQAYYTL